MMAKKMKKLFALLLALSMTMSLLSVTAFAEGEDSHNQVQCQDCGGSGHVLEDCPECEGGIVSEPCTAEGCEDGKILCAACEGTGMLPCFYCGGQEGGCMGCNGTGTEPCTKCKKTGYLDCTDCDGGVITSECTVEGCVNGWIDTGEECQTCGGTGMVDCTGSFEAGGISAVDAETGAGTVRYTCAVCGASYSETLSPEETAQQLAAGVAVTFTVDSAKANAGAKLTYTLTMKNGNAVDVSNLTAQLVLEQEAFSSMEYKVADTSGVEATSSYDESTGTLEITIPKIAAGKTLTATVTAYIAADAELGSDLEAACTATLQMNGDGEGVSLSGGSAGTHINKYQTARVYLCGAKMGGWYNPDDGRPNPTHEFSSSNPAATLDDFEGAVLSFAEAFNKETHPETGVINYSTNTKYYGETVKNDFDYRIWRCVGFVPCSGCVEKTEELSKYVYIDTNENDPLFQEGTLEDAQAAVKAAGGVLYGETADEALLQALEAAIENKSTSLVCVWYVTPEEPLTIGTYEDLSIEPVNPVNYQATSSGVTVSCGEITQKTPGHYEVELTVTIEAGAPNDIQVNLTEALMGSMEKLSEEFGAGAILPGDGIEYHITVVNNSGRTYRYRDGSAALGTLNHGGEAVLGTGFEGYPISEGYETEINGETVVMSIIPRRILNAPLKFLGVTTDGSDETIGKLLREKGYGAEETELTDAEITQTYLGQFYLDYLNKFVAEGEEKVTSFQDLTNIQMQILTDGNQSRGITETCRDVAEAFYYFYNGRAWLFNGLSLYDQMKNSSQLNSDFSTALAANTAFVLDAELKGFEVPNAFQNTATGWGMQFAMYVPTSTGEITPPPPTPPTPGTEIEEPDVPTGELPETPVEPEPSVEPEEPVELEDPDVPLGEAPETGDPLALWLALTSLSGLGLAGAQLTGRKRRQER